MNGIPLDYLSAPPLPTSPSRGLGRFVGSLITWILVAIAGMWLFTPVLGVPGFLLVLACSALIARTNRRRRALAVLSYVEQAVRLNLPLPAMLRAARDSESGVTARRLDALCSALEAGQPLELALAARVPELSPRMVQLAGAGGRLGSLPQTLRILIRQERAQRPRQTSLANVNLAYAMLLVLATVAMLSLYSIFVLPKFLYIFKDFKLEPPLVMRFMVKLGEMGAIIALVAAGLIIIGYAGMKVWEIFHPSSFPHEPWDWTAWLIWRTPLAHRIARDRGLGDVCRISGEALRAGFPIDRALTEATHLAVNPGLKAQLREWLSHVQDGAGIGESARKAGLPSLLSGMLHSAEVSGGMPDTFDFLGRYYESRFSRSALLLQNAVAPVMSLVFGAIVCVVALSLFVPMIRLIEKAGLR